MLNRGFDTDELILIIMKIRTMYQLKVKRHETEIEMRRKVVFSRQKPKRNKL